MRNLAGCKERVTKRVFSAELKSAGIPIVTTETYGEVNSPIEGVMRFSGGQTVTVRRAWYYHIFRISPGFPMGLAEALNRRWGKQIRVDGFGGGTDVDGDVELYHVDTLDGVCVLAYALRAAWGSES